MSNQAGNHGRKLSRVFCSLTCLIAFPSCLMFKGNTSYLPFFSHLHAFDLNQDIEFSTFSLLCRLCLTLVYLVQILLYGLFFNCIVVMNSTVITFHGRLTSAGRCCCGDRKKKEGRYRYHQAPSQLSLSVSHRTCDHTRFPGKILDFSNFNFECLQNEICVFLKKNDKLKV